MLGDLLRETRKQKNLSLDDVEKGTNIRKLYIKSIEDGDYDKLPGEVFLKGFIKTYGKFLGLNSQQLITQYKNEKNMTITESVDIPEPQSSPTPTQPTVTSVNNDETPIKKVEKVEKNIPKIDSFKSNQEFLQPQKSNSKKNIFIVILILIIIIGGAIFFLSNQETSDTKTPVHTTEQESTPPTSDANTQAPAPVINDAEVKATFSDDCWTEVKVDGNIVLSETVKKGTSLEWKGSKQVDITVGNAGAIDITFNNQAIGKLGDVGAVVTKSFVAPSQANNNQQPNQTTK